MGLDSVRAWLATNAPDLRLITVEASTATVAEAADALGVETVLTPVRAPRANGVAERVIDTLRRECLDHVIPLDERHLHSILAEYVRYYNHDRPHRTLRMETPRPQECLRAGPIQALRARPVRGGLHHTYEPAAA